MKCTIPEISWHNKDPVLSIDIQPPVGEKFYRIASGGTDSHILVSFHESSPLVSVLLFFFFCISL